MERDGATRLFILLDIEHLVSDATLQAEFTHAAALSRDTLASTAIEPEAIMNILARLKIGQRLVAGFASVLVLALVVGVFSISRLAQVNANTTELATNWLQATRMLSDFKTQVSILRRAEASSLMSGKPEVVGAQTRRIETTKAKAAEAWKGYMATVDLPEERAIAADIEAARERYYAALGKSLAVAADEAATPEGHDKALAHYEGESKASFDALFGAIAHDVEFQVKGGDGAYQSSQATYAGARLAIIGLLAAAVALARAAWPGSSRARSRARSNAPSRWPRPWPPAT